MSSFFKLSQQFSSVKTTDQNIKPLSKSTFVCPVAQQISQPIPKKKEKKVVVTQLSSVDVRDTSITEIDCLIKTHLSQKQDNGTSLALYDVRSDTILQEYKKFQNQQPRSFLVGQFKKPDKKYEEVCRRYYTIAQLYISLSGITRIPSVMTCEWCDGASFTMSNDDDSVYICDCCFGERELLDDNPSFKDTDRVNMASKYTYSESGHFSDEIKKFQGTQNYDEAKIGNVIRIIEGQMVLHDLIAEPGHKNSINKDEIYAFLVEQGLSDHYGDLNLLYSKITKTQSHDLSNIIEALYEDFETLNKVLTDIQDENRVNSLTVGHILYKLLQKHKYPCRKTDFYILKTQSKEDEHDEKIKEAWGILGWSWIPTY